MIKKKDRKEDTNLRAFSVVKSKNSIVRWMIKEAH